jgi:hypothetical protein
MRDEFNYFRNPAQWKQLRTSFPDGATHGHSARSMLCGLVEMLEEKLVRMKTGPHIGLDLLNHRQEGELIFRVWQGHIQKSMVLSVKVMGESILSISRKGYPQTILYLSGASGTARLIDHVLTELEFFDESVQLREETKARECLRPGPR